MLFRINHTVAAYSVQRSISAANADLSRSLQRVASGLRINSAADDAAGLQVLTGLQLHAAGLKASVLNAEMASNLLQTAEGSLAEVNTILNRLKALATQAASSTVSDADRGTIQAEFSDLVTEIDRIAQSTTYNNQVLLTGFGNSLDSASTAIAASDSTGVTNVRLSGAEAGTYTFLDTDEEDNEVTLGNGTVTQTLSMGTVLDDGMVATGTQIVANFDSLGVVITLAGPDVADATGQFSDGDLNGQQLVVEEGSGGTFQIGPADDVHNRLQVSIADMSASGDELNLGSIDVESLSTASVALTTVESAVSRVAVERGTLGAAQNRLSYAIAANSNALESAQASESTIGDADIALEVSRVARSQLLVQMGSAVLMQANNLQRQNIQSLLASIG